VRIFKYPLRMGLTEVQMPVGARFLAFGMQREDPVLWAEVEPGEPTVTRTFDIYPTGFTVPKGWEWRGTVQDGPFVWHLYELAGP
jgi:hypothetical protein